MRILFSITSKLKWVGLFISVFSNALGIDRPYSSWIFYIVLIMFFIEPPALQSLYQLLGMLFLLITRRSNFPSKDNFISKVDYILPFNGKWTVINGGVDKNLSHSWSIYTQRYAYDFFILDDEGNTFDGDNKSLKSYFCYRKDIIAPADGVVVKAYDKHKDSYVDGKKAYCASQNMIGNNIVIKHCDNEYSAIAHIMPHSIMVNVGDTVKQGDVIAKCGNSGNTSQPHIHFQLQTGKSFFFSAGLPIAFSSIRAQEKTGYELIDKRPCIDNLQVIGDKSYIGRGLEVENIIG